MAKGKKGKEKKSSVEQTAKDPNLLTEVDKTFYELQITDLNRKLARLRELTTNLEDKNQELETKYLQLDEDRADVIAYLKKQVIEKQNEASEMQERLVALQEAKDTEEVKFNAKVLDMDEEYLMMKEQLTSEIKLITGKLNALEEFRINRDDLMKKFVEQENLLAEQEIKQKRTLYEAEKMYIMSKDTIKKEMEKRILELAVDFQAANEIRIAATTHRVIRENITINNEMDKLMEIIERLTGENATLKEKNKVLRQNCELYTTEKNIALGDASLYRGVIDQMKAKHKKLSEDLDQYKTEVNEARMKETELVSTKNEIINLSFKVRLLEQNLHAVKCREVAAKTLLNQSELKSQQLKEVLFEAIEAIEEALSIQPGQEESLKYAKREALLYHLLKMITEGKQQAVRCDSTETIESVAATYIKGDLGFVPKPLPPKKPPVLIFNMDTQVGKSLEDLQREISSQMAEAESSTMSVITKSHSQYIQEEEIDESFTSEASEEEVKLEEHAQSEDLSPKHSLAKVEDTGTKDVKEEPKEELGEEQKEEREEQKEEQEEEEEEEIKVDNTEEGSQ